MVSMKKTLLIASILFSFNSIADEQCALDQSLNQIDELHQNNCEALDKMKTCAEKSVDPDAQKKRIEGWFNVAEERKEKIIAEKKPVPKNSYGGLFQVDDLGDDGLRLTHINDFLTFNGKVQNEKTAKLKEVIIDKFVKFSRQYNCEPIIKTSYTSTPYPWGQKFRTEEQFEDFMDQPGFKEDKEKYFSKVNSSPNNESICDPSSAGRIEKRIPTDIIYPPCAGNVAGFFKDNEWTSSTLDNNLDTPEANELSACIKDRMSKGGVIDKINIESSASALNNSGEAGKRFCKKGFKELSRARAETARDKIVPKLFAKAGANAQGLTVDVFPEGSNKDGTSGPCPYEIKDGKEVLKSEYMTAEGKKSLDDHKYVKVNVVFKEVKKPVSGEYFFTQMYMCRNFKFECMPKTGEQSKVGQAQSNPNP